MLFRSQDGLHAVGRSERWDGPGSTVLEHRHDPIFRGQREISAHPFRQGPHAQVAIAGDHCHDITRFVDKHNGFRQIRLRDMRDFSNLSARLRMGMRYDRVVRTALFEEKPYGLCHSHDEPRCNADEWSSI